MALEVEIIRHAMRNASSFKSKHASDLDQVKNHVRRHINHTRTSICASRERMKGATVEKVGSSEIPRLDRFLSGIRVHETDMIHELSRKSLDLDGKEFVSGEWIFPEQKSKKYMLFLHGGAYVFMEAETHRNITVSMARKLGLNVLSVDYRLAPEYAFPGKKTFHIKSLLLVAGLFDAVSAYFYLIKTKGCKGSDIMIAGKIHFLYRMNFFR